MPEVQAAIDQAKNNPNDFDAQIKAADMYEKIQKFDEAIEFLTVANKIKPDDRQTIVRLGNDNYDADKFEEAEKWYAQALSKKPDDVNVWTDMGLTFVLRPRRTMTAPSTNSNDRSSTSQITQRRCKI